MSAVSAVPPSNATRRPAHGRVTQVRVLRSELTKLWTLRSSVAAMVAAVVAMIGIPIGIAAVQMNRWYHLNPHDRATFDAIDNAVGGYQFAQLAIGVLGVLVISGEYSTGMIRSSFSAVPKRLPVLWAKLGVYCSAVFASMLVSSFVAFFATQPIVHKHGLDRTLGDGHALRCVVGAALFLTVLAAFGVGLGALIRNTAGGIATFAGVLFVLPGITALLPQSTADSVNPYLPLNAGTTILTNSFDPDQQHHLSAWGGLGVFAAYAAVTLIAAAVLMRRRDA